MTRLSHRPCLAAALIALAGAALCDPAGGHAAPRIARPALTWVKGDGSYTKASRSPRSITTIVIHATDGGSLGGNVWWLSGGHSHASANYVIARDGSIVQLVHLSDIAWHAGNRKVNRHSIGIEHVGETYDPNGFTAAEYESSARLVAWLVTKYAIPVDRKHIIGHSQVPDPKDPSLFGGSDHHTDPGPHWRWGFYLSLVRRYAFPARYALRVDTTSFKAGTSLTGIAPWQVRASGPGARRVDFFVDGELLWSDSRRPFAFAGGRGWNTTAIANGTHELAVRVTGGDRSAWQRLTVRVVNHDFALTTSKLHAWQKVHGLVRIRANVRGASTTGIALYVDGKVTSRDRRAPFTLRWNSQRVRDGGHRVTLAAVAPDGRVARRTLELVVSNRVRHTKTVSKKPPAKPVTLPIRIVSEDLADGAAVSGVVQWSAHTLGPVARVVLSADGTQLATLTTEPWTATWDATTVAAGPHVLGVRAFTTDGRSAATTITVTVTQPAQASSP